MTLGTIYFEMTWGIWKPVTADFYTPDGIRDWLMLKFGYTHEQANRLTRILWGWLISGYIPAGRVSLMRWGHCRDNKQPAYYRKIFGCKLWA